MNKKEHITKLLRAYKKALKEIDPKDSFKRTLAKLKNNYLGYGICHYSSSKLGIDFNYKCFNKYKIWGIMAGRWVDWFYKPINLCKTKSEIRENLQTRIDILAKELKKCK